MYEKNITQFPAQKKSWKDKDKKWREQCVDAGEEAALFNNSEVRSSHYNKRTNYELYNQVINRADMEKVFNPLGLEGTIPAKLQHYPIINTNVDLLLGEESKRRFDYRIMAVNDDAISLKESRKAESVKELLIQSIQSKKLDQETLQKELGRMQKYMNYEYADLREVKAMRLCKYFEHKLNLKRLFNEGFQDKLIAGEEIYEFSFRNGDPYVERVDPLNLFVVRTGRSKKIKDADIVVYASYRSIGEVIDMFGDKLSDKEIDAIESGDNMSTPERHVGSQHQPIRPLNLADYGGSGLIEVNTNMSNYYGGSYDEDGNVKVTRVTWKSFRKIGELTYFNEDGEMEFDIVDEYYPVDEAKGESVTWRWLPEWWSGYKIREDIYIKIDPYEANVYDMDSLMLTTSPFAGEFSSVNSMEAKSLVDRMKPYSYLYDIYQGRKEFAISKYKGPIIEMDMSKIPQGWTPEQAFYYAENMGYMMVNSFNEGKKGSATGKLAGNFTSTGKVLNPDMGNFIMHLEQITQTLKQEMQEIVGITEQRKGNIAASAGASTTQQAVVSSSYTTEIWFIPHEETKIEVMMNLLEMAKIAYRGKSKTIQYIDDGLVNVMDVIDGDAFSESTYGVFMTSSIDNQELKQNLMQLAHAAMQNDKAKLSDIASLYMNQSIAGSRRLIEKAEMEAEQRVAEQQQQALESQERIAGEAAQIEQSKLELEKYKIDMDNQVKLEVAAMKVNDGDADNNNVLDQIQLEKLQLDREKMQKDFEIKNKELEIKKKQSSNSKTKK